MMLTRILLEGEQALFPEYHAQVAGTSAVSCPAAAEKFRYQTYPLNSSLSQGQGATVGKALFAETRWRAKWSGQLAIGVLGCRRFCCRKENAPKPEDWGIIHEL